MSHAASTWAYSQTIKPASRKFVLVALADNADVHGRAYPSIVTLGLKTGLDRKTIIAALDSLEADGYLHDTDERIGATRQVKVYRLNAFSDEAHYAAPRVPGAKSQASNRTENGTVEQSQKGNSTENGTVPFFPPKSTVFPTKQYRKRYTEPSVNRQ